MAGSLAIERFRITGLAPGDHPAPDRLKALVERVDSRRLTRTIGQALGTFGDDDGRIIILRRLDLALAENRIDDVDRLARQLAQGIAAAVVRLSTMQATGDIAIFASAGARIAAFVAALVRGDAWGRWWFSGFEGLKLLPTSAAIRIALLRDPAAGLDALRHIGDGDRFRIVTTLSAIDALRLLEGLAPALDEAQDERCWVEAFAMPRTPSEWPVALAMLHDLSILAGRDPELPRTVLTALKLRATLDRAAPAERLAQLIRAGSGRALASLAPDLQLKDFAGLLALPAATRDSIAQAIGAQAEQAALPCPAYTPFGAMLLLWPHLPPVDADALPDGPGDKAGLVALLSLASLFGHKTSRAVLADSVLRKAFGVDPRAGQIELADWLGSIGPSDLPAAALASRQAGLPPVFRTHRRQMRAVKALGLAALADFARRLPGFAGASLPFLRVNLIGIGARVLVTNAGVHAVLDRPPLDVLLSISGLADRSIEMSDGRRLELERAP